MFQIPQSHGLGYVDIHYIWRRGWRINDFINCLVYSLYEESDDALLDVSGVWMVVKDVIKVNEEQFRDVFAFVKNFAAFLWRRAVFNDETVFFTHREK